MTERASLGRATVMRQGEPLLNWEGVMRIVPLRGSSASNLMPLCAVCATERITAPASVIDCKKALPKLRGMRGEFGRKEVEGEVNCKEQRATGRRPRHGMR